MFIEIIDSLRCPRDHDETWLVAACNVITDRFVVKGKLGCPICYVEYPIDNGIADFRTGHGPLIRLSNAPWKSDGDHALRLAAFLNLTNPGGTVLLCGANAPCAAQVAALTQSRVIAVNPPCTIDDSELVATVMVESHLPFATASVDGIAVADSTFSPDEISRVLKPGARAVTPASTRLAGTLRELARDTNYVVAEATGPLLTLRR